MPPTLTPAVSRALDAAQRYVAAGESEIQPIHLLHGLLEEEYGRGASLAEQAGLDRESYLKARAEPGAGPSAPLELGRATANVLNSARDLAVGVSGESAVVSEAVLLALVRHDPNLEGWLAKLGMQRDQLESLLQQSSPPPAALETPLDLIDLTERMELARIQDVSFNRARESLRIVEDYCRFGIDDAFLTEQFKQLRHELTQSVQELGPEEMLLARETINDVGTSISTEGERQRASLRAVVRANCQRLQESLRSLEEFAKVNRPLLAERVEQYRYRAYTLERAVIGPDQARRLLRDARLYVLLTGADCAAGLDWTISEAAAGGASIVQLREKTLPDEELLQRARGVRRWTRRAGVLFIVNDRPDIARLVDADGVHLGQDDLPVKEARQIVGPDALVGVSTHSLDQLRQAILDGASYVGVGPVFPSRTKDFDTLAGVEFLRAAVAETSLPAFAIGGINLETVTAAVEAGARRVAVGQAIAAADDPRGVAMQLLAALPAIAKTNT